MDTLTRLVERALSASLLLFILLPVKFTAKDGRPNGRAWVGSVCEGC